jgi:putative MATE family efflux protein
MTESPNRDDPMTDPALLRRQRLLGAPILPTMLGLAGPTVVVLLVQTMVGVAETYYVSNLGTAALAGVALVFPALMLMQMMSNGGIGGGVSAAIARALGAGRRADADALVLHALIVAVGFGLVFTAFEFAAGRFLYRAMGGKGDVLAAALGYADVVFAGSVLIWLTSLLAAALRGAGNVRAPALITLLGALVIVPLSPALIFGWGPLPRLGVAGAGTAVVVYYIAASAALILYLRSGRAGLALSFDLRRLEWRLFGEVLRVGGLSAVGTIQMNLTVALVTGLVGLFGAEAVAGYGIASRVDYLLIPLLFGLGTSALTMVGTNIGAGQFARARRIAWTGAILSAAITEAIGIAVAVFPHAWLGLFSADPDVLATGTRYFRAVAPFYGFTGLGMLLYFAGQGAGRVGWPVAAGLARLVIAGLGGWLIVTQAGQGLAALFTAVACASFAFGSITAASVALGAWNHERGAAPGMAIPEPRLARPMSGFRPS